MATNTRFLKIDGGFERYFPGGNTVFGSPQGTMTSTPSTSRTLNLNLGTPPQPTAPASSVAPTVAAPMITQNTATAPANTSTIASDPFLLRQTPLPTSTTEQPSMPSYNSSDAFAFLLTDALKQAQGVTTADLLKRKRELQRAAISASTNTPFTPEERSSLSPAQQSAIRSGNIAALEPDIDQNSYEIEKANQQLDNFFRVADEVRKISSDFADKMVAPDNVIQNAKAVIEADPSKMSSILASFNDKTKERIINSLDYTKLTPKEAAPSRNQITDNELSARNAFVNNPIVKDYNTILGKKLSVDSIIQNGTGGPADLAVVYEFMKGLDPTSVVRETEYASAAKSGNIFAGALTKFNGYFKPEGGFLPENVKKEFQNIVSQKLKVQTDLYNNFAGQTRAIAERQGLDPNNVVPDFSAAASSGQRETKTINGIQYEKTDGGWKKVSFNKVGADTNNRPQRNNNPLNVKAGSYTKTAPGVVAIDPVPATDGGQFLVFDSPESGFAAADRLITSDLYNSLSVDQALRKWSGGGYGGEIIPSLKGRKVADLAPQERQLLLQTMAQREGYYA